MNRIITINPEPPMRHTDPRAAHAARATQIHAKLARLQQLADEHFGHDPDAVHWGHVGDIGRVEQAFEELLDIFDGKVARREGLHPTTVNELLRLTLLSPTLVKGLLAGRQPRTLSLIWLKNHEVPASWDDQAALFGRMDR